VSAATNTPAPADLVVCGEIGLGGEVRSVAQTSRRIAEAARLGFSKAIVPATNIDTVKHKGITVLGASSLAEALALAQLAQP
jgi:DNA repair protein RadA/Sms